MTQQAKIKKTLCRSIIGIFAIAALSASHPRQEPVLSRVETSAQLDLERNEQGHLQLVSTRLLYHCDNDADVQFVVPIRIDMDLAQARLRGFGPQRRVAIFREIEGAIGEAFVQSTENVDRRDILVFSGSPQHINDFAAGVAAGYGLARRITIKAEAIDAVAFGPGCGVKDWEEYANMRNAHRAFIETHSRTAIEDLLEEFNPQNTETAPSHKNIHLPMTPVNRPALR